MRLLKDEEIGDLLGLEKEKVYPCSLGSVHTLDVDAVLDAEHTKTLKAVAEWLEPLCLNKWYEGYEYQRMNCGDCVATMVMALHEGKMPGEE